MVFQWCQKVNYGVPVVSKSLLWCSSGVKKSIMVFQWCQKLWLTYTWVLQVIKVDIVWPLLYGVRLGSNLSWHTMHRVVISCHGWQRSCESWQRSSYIFIAIIYPVWCANHNHYTVKARPAVWRFMVISHVAFSCLAAKQETNAQVTYMITHCSISIKQHWLLFADALLLKHRHARWKCHKQKGNQTWQSIETLIWL